MSALGKISAGFRTILGLSGLAGTDDQIASTAKNVCPSVPEQEAQQCLIDAMSQINCPEGQRKQFLELICQFDPTVQKGLIDRTMRPVEMTLFSRVAISAATTSILLIDESIATGTGTSYFDKGKLPNTTDHFVLCGISLLYGRGATPTSAIYGRMATQNEVPAGGVVNYSYLELPGEIATSEVLFEINNRKIWQRESASRFRNFSYEQNQVGYSWLSSQHLIKGTDMVRFNLKLGSQFTPPAVGGASNIELMFHGVGIMPA